MIRERDKLADQIETALARLHRAAEARQKLKTKKSERALLAAYKAIDAAIENARQFIAAVRKRKLH